MRKPRDFEKLYKGCEKSFLVAVDKAIALQNENQELRARIAELEADLAATKEPFLYELNQRMAVTTQNTKLHRRIDELEAELDGNAKLHVDGMKAAYARILELEIAQRWIPVGERLPDDGIAVLVWDVNHPRQGWLEDGLWQDDQQNYLSVTHWMDLPGVPGGEK